jgi:hypothetical protein
MFEHDMVVTKACLRAESTHSTEVLQILGHKIAMPAVPVQVLEQMTLCPLEQMPLYASFVFRFCFFVVGEVVVGKN